MTSIIELDVITRRISSDCLVSVCFWPWYQMRNLCRSRRARRGFGAPLIRLISEAIEQNLQRRDECM